VETTNSTTDWKDHPDLNPVLYFPTYCVPSKHVQSVLREPRFQPLLASTTQFSGRQKIRLVQSFNNTHQLVLLNSEHALNDKDSVADLLKSLEITNGPLHSLQLDASYFSIQDILQILSIPPVTAYEQVGHVVHLNLREEHQSHRQVIGEVCLTILPNMETVVQKVGQVHGSHRTYDMEVLAGTNNTDVTVVESGVSVSFNLEECYWNSRLAGERQYLLQHEFKDNQTIVDAFSGVGMMCLLTAIKLSNTQVYANDINPCAIEALQQAAKRSHVSKSIHTSCGDAYEFLVDMGLEWETLPHHVVMNYPLEAASFLNALRWWRVPKKRDAVIPTMHVYTFARGANPMQSAIDLVAHNLLPEGNEPTPNRTDYLNKLGCNVKAREIRDVAPGKLVVCVSFKATAQLLRHMQGDFV